MGKTVILAQRPDIVVKLEKYGLVPKGHKGGKFEGCAKKWASEQTPPYDKPEYRALAERLPTGWEELTVEEVAQLRVDLAVAVEKKKIASLGIPNKGSEKLVRNLTKTIYVGVATASALLKESGIGITPDRDEKAAAEAQEFSFELILHLLTGSEMLKTVFKTISRTVSASVETQEFIAEVLYLIGLVMILQTGSQGNEKKLKALFLSFKPALNKGIEQVQRFIGDCLNKGAIEGDVAERLSLYLHEAHLGLEREDVNSFYEAFTDAMKLTGVEPERLAGDLKNLQGYAELLKSVLTTGMDEETKKISTVSQVM